MYSERTFIAEVSPKWPGLRSVVQVYNYSRAFCSGPLFLFASSLGTGIQGKTIRYHCISERSPGHTWTVRITKLLADVFLLNPCSCGHSSSGTGSQGKTFANTAFLNAAIVFYKGHNFVTSCLQIIFDTIVKR